MKVGKWSCVRATTIGWFFSRDGETAYCPNHLPPQIVEWRKNRRQ